MVNRRKFLTGLGAITAMSPITGFPAIVKRRNANELLSHAAIGAGNMAWCDLDGLASHRDIHITAICDVDSKYLEKAKAKFPEARVYRDAFEMIAAEGNRIDSVNVSTPDHTHAQYILEALKRGMNVYAQKPLCHDLEECAAIEKLAAEKQAVTQMGTQIAAWECDRRTAAALKSGKIGEIKHVWIFSTRRDPSEPSEFAWPLKEDPIPETLDWKLWLGPAKYRPYSSGVYHPGAWRRWREFGTSWLGDLGLHLMSPVWIGMNLGAANPKSVIAEIADDDWTDAQREQFWPSMSHVIWTFPGCKASGGKEFQVEWCDGFGSIANRLEPKFLPPAFLHDIAAKTPMGGLPQQGRVIEGSEGWLLSTHYAKSPWFVMKNGKVEEAACYTGPAPSHWHEFVNCCLSGGTPQSSFAWTARMTQWGFLGNLAQLQPGKAIEYAG